VEFVVIESSRTAFYPGTFLANQKAIYRTVTFVAAGPFGPSSISKETRSPSLSDLKPVVLLDSYL